MTKIIESTKGRVRLFYKWCIIDTIELFFICRSIIVTRYKYFLFGFHWFFFFGPHISTSRGQTNTFLAYCSYFILKTIIKNSFEETDLVINRPLKSCHNVLFHKRFTQYQHKIQDNIGCNISTSRGQTNTFLAYCSYFIFKKNSVDMETKFTII
jgi:hypothetical protein